MREAVVARRVTVSRAMMSVVGLQACTSKLAREFCSSTEIGSISKAGLGGRGQHINLAPDGFQFWFGEPEGLFLPVISS
jgi:hypothetical protein